MFKSSALPTSPSYERVGTRPSLAQTEIGNAMRIRALEPPVVLWKTLESSKYGIYIYVVRSTNSLPKQLIAVLPAPEITGVLMTIKSPKGASVNS